jgi:hypothetical protein
VRHRLCLLRLIRKENALRALSFLISPSPNSFLLRKNLSSRLSHVQPNTNTIRRWYLYLVDLVRLELTTPCLRGRCSNRLSYRSDWSYSTLFYRFYKGTVKNLHPKVEIYCLGRFLPIIQDWLNYFTNFFLNLFDRAVSVY